MESLKKNSVIFYLAVCMTGCASYKYNATVPRAISLESFAPVQFRVAEVDGLMSEQERGMISSVIAMRNRQANSWMNAGGQKTLINADHLIPEIEKGKADLLNETLIKRYPTLFSAGKNAIPVRIQMKQEMENSVASTMLIGLCTLGLLPAPLKITTDISVETVILLSAERSALRLPDRKAQLKITGWMTVYSPLGLIPFPGEGEKKWSAVLPLFPLASQNPFKCSEQQFIELCVHGGTADKERLDAVYGSMADLVAASVTSLNDEQLNEIKSQYFKSMRVY